MERKIKEKRIYKIVRNVKCSEVARFALTCAMQLKLPIYMKNLYCNWKYDLYTLIYHAKYTLCVSLYELY